MSHFLLIFMYQSDLQLSSAHDSQLQLFGSLEGHGGKVNACAFSFNGEWLASGGSDRKVLIWSVINKKLKYTIDPGSDGHTAHITYARFSHDDRLILGTTSHDKTVRIWDLSSVTQANASTVKLIQILKGHNTTVTSVDFSPSPGSNHCMSCDLEGELRLWDFTTGQCEQSMKMVSLSFFKRGPQFLFVH
ncbi:WD40-repeat-containing domain protein [Lobosporangium transversale]|uniref:WD40-repeat-containing domain protein n=1 Tax=Lobosporangium transversale TaxID=64571 RepID=A0A1Y2GLU2_9FUNG|nr:WD40-repeat-containing domain protein [Lobosporangium transversale]ORZ12895.1 WD40-repeat-containing domain protein [Lobosporangium transversale]|eukprot:XP_021880244.1 WD40-repeat-containing domain protein [Lobosporangium transversale]